MNCDVNVESNNTNSYCSKVNCSNKQNDHKMTTITKDLCLAQIYAFIKEVVDTCLEGNSLQLKDKTETIFSLKKPPNEIIFSCIYSRKSMIMSCQLPSSKHLFVARIFLR